MHDRKGRLIELGDHVVFGAYMPGGLRKTVGRVSETGPGNKTCNLTVAHLVPGYYPVQQATVTAAETEIVLKSDGSVPQDCVSVKSSELHAQEYGGHNA